MSVLTQCNYCTLKLLKKKYGEALIRRGDGFYVKDPKGDYMLMPEGTRARFIAWFMAIPEECCC